MATPDGSNEQDILVVELLNPAYDADAATLTYDATVLADYGERGLANLARQQTDYELAASFGEGSLFIDDCPDSYNDACWNTTTPMSASVGYVTSGNCWYDWICKPCGSYSGLCNQTYPEACQGQCADDIYLCTYPGCH